jgi:hypothetical protein
MKVKLALLAALALAAPPAASGRSNEARLLVSATVVRTVRVSVVEGAAGAGAVSVSIAGGGAWSAPVEAAAGTAGGAERSAADPSYVVVTVLADGPLPARREAGAR